MPSFVDVVTGALAKASDVQQIIDALKGTAGKGIPLSLTSVNDAINFALSVKNNDATASKTAVFYKADGTVLFQIDKNGVIASADGTTSASQIPTLTGTQSFTNKSTSYISGQGNTLTVPAARVFSSAGTVVTASTLTAITLDSERYKTDAGMHSNVTNNSRLTATVAGKYRIAGHIDWTAATTGTLRQISIRLNGATIIASQGCPPSSGAVSIKQSVSTTYALALNDYVELMGFQDTAGSITVAVGGNWSPEFEMEFVSA